MLQIKWVWIMCVHQACTSSSFAEGDLNNKNRVSIHYYYCGKMFSYMQKTTGTGLDNDVNKLNENSIHMALRILICLKEMEVSMKENGSYHSIC